MIDEARTLELFGYTSDELGNWSKKPIAVICEKCGEPRTCRNDSYRDLCMACAQIGKTHTMETKQKMSNDRRGENNSNFGKPMSDATKQKLSKINTGASHPQFGTHCSESTRQKISESERGKAVSIGTKQKLSESNSGKVQPIAQRKKRSATMQGIPYDEWESFATNSPYCPKFNNACKESNREKYARRCFLSGATEDQNGKKLSVHHVDMNKDQGCDGHIWKLVPLAAKWHSRAHTDIWMSRIQYLLDNVW